MVRAANDEAIQTKHGDDPLRSEEAPCTPVWSNNYDAQICCCVCDFICNFVDGCVDGCAGGRAGGCGCGNPPTVSNGSERSQGIPSRRQGGGFILDEQTEGRHNTRQGGCRGLKTHGRLVMLLVQVREIVGQGSQGHVLFRGHVLFHLLHNIVHGDDIVEASHPVVQEGFPRI